MATKGLQPRDPVGLAKAVQQFCQTEIKYLREYPETLATPERTLEWRVGDCDDLTILTCAALRGAKIPCRAVFVGWAPKGSVGPITFKHVFPEAWLPLESQPMNPQAGQWVSLESVRVVPFGWNVVQKRLAKGFRVRSASIGDREGLFLGDE